MTVQERFARFRGNRSREGGYVAVLTALLMVVLVGMAAFAVDVGRWYVVGQQAQRAADAAALAGVTSLPGDMPAAVTNAKNFSKINGFDGAVLGTTVTAGQDLTNSRPTRLRVTVSRTVNNIFGPLMGVPTTTVTRTAVADFGGPIPMGSPCNEFGNDPDPANQGDACADVTGQMWANVNSLSSEKQNGDAYQSKVCSKSADNCSSNTNNEWNSDGYFYTVSVKSSSMASLTIQLFDPVFVDVGLACDALDTQGRPTNFGNGGSQGNKLAINAVNLVVTDPATRYKPGASEPYCTGDALYDNSNHQVMNTKFTVREPSASLWNPATFNPVCTKTYPGYTGPLYDVLNKASATTYDKPAGIVDGFRRWTTLCTITAPKVGDYVIQVQTNLGGSLDNANAGNRFAMRAYGANLAENNSLSISGRERMGIYSNKPGAITTFHLARVPTGAAGQLLSLRLFDVGDSNKSGKITVVFPPDPDATGAPFIGCKGALGTAAPVDLTDCAFSVIYNAPNSDHQGKWQTVTVPIPPTYSCNDLDPRKCWVRLKYDYLGGSPTDVTSWAASIDGDPVRLVE